MKHLQKTAFALFLFFCSFNSYAQDAIYWQKCLGGSADDDIYDGRKTSDGGYILAGSSTSIDMQVSGNHGDKDYWIVKVDDTGAIQWQKSLGGSNTDEARSVIQTTDGGYIVAGRSYSADGNVSVNYGSSDIWIVKLNDTGGMEWQKTLGGSAAEQCYSIIQAADGNYVIAGGSQSTDGDLTENHGNFDYWIVKINTTGSIMWQKSYGGIASDIARSIAQTTDGGYIIAGGANSCDGQVADCRGGGDYWIVKIDDTGSIQWKKSIGGTNLDAAFSIIVTGDNFVVTGIALSNDIDVTGNHGGADAWVVKLNSTGTILWQKSLGGSNNELSNCIKMTSDDGFVMLGATTSNDGDVTGNHGGNDLWLTKLNADGNLEWQKTLGGSFWDNSAFVEQTSDGAFVVGGLTPSNDGDVTGNHGGDDYWILKTNYEGPEQTQVYSTENKVSIYPNPTSNIINIKATDRVTTELVSVTGARVISRTNNTVLSTSSLPAGLYMLNVYNAEGMKIKVEKIIKN